ncbi:MAG: hypothetical protein RBS34_16375 [Desulfofustis sp.]|jgi:hypothetical protein|nr:hypothetical protein [Desulfofustis sp.]
MNTITVCRGDRLNYTKESGFTYTNTYGESFSFGTASEFIDWWELEGGPELGEEVEQFLFEDRE